MSYKNLIQNGLKQVAFFLLNVCKKATSGVWTCFMHHTIGCISCEYRLQEERVECYISCETQPHSSVNSHATEENYILGRTVDTVGHTVKIQ